MCLVSLRPTARPANTTIEKVLACTYFNNGYAEWLQIYEAIGLNTLLSRVRQRNHEKPYNTEKEPYCCGNGYRTITVLLYRWWMLEWWSYQNIKILKSIIIYWIVHRSYFPYVVFRHLIWKFSPAHLPRGPVSKHELTTDDWITPALLRSCIESPSIISIDLRCFSRHSLNFIELLSNGKVILYFSGTYCTIIVGGVVAEYQKISPV